MFADRVDAGRRLAEKLSHLKGLDVVVLALPRGGVPVAYQVARALDAPLDLILVRKLGAPFQPELAMGAVVDGGHPQIVINEIFDRPEYKDAIEAEAQRELHKIENRRAAYFGDKPRPSIAGKTVVVVDDGIATGATMRVALRSVVEKGAARVIMAVPVAPPEVVAELSRDVDEAVCVETPEPFGAVGAFYRDFGQTEDDEVVELLRRANEGKSFLPR